MRNGALIQIELTVTEPLSQLSEKINNEREISIYLNAINAEKVNESLKKIFGNKYEASFVGEGSHQCSPNTAGECSQIENSEDSRQFAINTRRGTQSRVAAATLNRQSYAWKSPSTTSTTSLLLLKEKLSEYPGCVGTSDEEYGGVCAKPLLPRVTEECEEDICILTPRTKPRCNAVFSHKIKVRDSVDKTTVSKPSTISLVLATTIDSYEATAPHDTLDGFPEDLELNTLNYMAYRQQNKSESTSDLQSEVIENTPFVRPILEAREKVQVCDKNYKKHYELIEADVIQCVKDLIDQVCADYETISHLMNEKEFTNKLLIEAGLPITTQSEHRPMLDTQKTKKITAKPIQITFPKTKEKVNKRKGQRRQKRPESEAASKLSIAYETDGNLKSPNNNIKGPITRRRRKLYSPKDNLTFEGPVDPETGVEQTRTPKTSKTPYREIQEMRATHRESTKRKSIPEKVVLSPRSKRLNDDFDKLLQPNCNDVSLKKSNNTKDISVYNYTDSDDSDFKDGNLRKPSLPLRKSNASVNLMEKKSRKRKQKCINVSRDTLIDERMRNATADLNTSFTIEEPIETCGNVEPVIVLEPIIEDENNSTKKSRIVKSRETKKDTKSRNGPKKANKRKNAKRTTTKVMNLSRDRDESISPGLKCELQVAEKKPNDSLTDLDKINIIEKAEKEDYSFEYSDCVYETIETKATIEHVPLVNAPIERIRKSRGLSSRDQPETLTQSIENNNVTPEAPNNEICRNKISEDECAQRLPRVSVERMSEEDIKEWLSPRAKSSISGGTSKPSPKPEANLHTRLPVGDKSHLFSPRCVILRKNDNRKICDSLILPFKNNKKSKTHYNRHTPELKRQEPDVDNTEKDICRNSSSIRAVSLKIRKTPKAFNNRVLKTPDSKENLIKDFPIKRRAEKSRSSSDSDKRRITRRALERPISGDDSSSREEESECSMKECSNAETIHNWLNRSRHELDTEEFDGVRVNVFGDIFKEVQKKIDYDLAKIKNNARNSLEHIQRGVVKQIEEARLRRRALYTESAREIFSDIGKILDAKFTELEAKCERVDDQVLENVSRDSTQMLSEIATIQLDLVSYLDARTDI